MQVHRSTRRAGGLMSLVAGLILGGAAPAAALEPGDPEPAVQPTIDIQIRDQLISLTAEAVPARLALEHLAQRCGLLLEIAAPLERRLSLRLYRRPLHEVIARLLGDHSYVLHFRRALLAEDGGGYLWVLADGTAEPAPAPDPLALALQREARLTKLARMLERDEPAARDELRHAAGDVDPAVRAAAISGLAELGDHASDAWLRLALSDPDESVREAAIEAAASRGGEFAVQALAAALHDRAPARREQALYALAELPSAAVNGLLNVALGDSDARLRELAAELLAERGG